jgi:hypothetical protein
MSGALRKASLNERAGVRAFERALIPIGTQVRQAIEKPLNLKL